MQFEIRFGVPEMLDYWKRLKDAVDTKTATKDQLDIFNKLFKCLRMLQADPKYPSLHSHEISQLSSRYGIKVFESYLENKTPRALRLFWVYGPYKQCITVIGIEPHPNDKSNAYEKIKLSSPN